MMITSRVLASKLLEWLVVAFIAWLLFDCLFYSPLIG